MKASLLRKPGAPVLRVGHRGARGHAPENTLASFSLALEMGVDAVETDVHLSKDGEVVIIHDHTVDRTTNGHGWVSQKTVDELKLLDAGAWFDARFAGERILTLTELLLWARNKVGLAIEIKNGPIYYPGIAEKTIRLLHEYAMLDRAILLSFDHFVLREAKALAPEVATGILYAGRLIDAVAAGRAAGADSLNPAWPYITPDLVKVAHAAGLAVSAWCPNDLESLRLVDRLGVDSIGTDFPDLFDRL